MLEPDILAQMEEADGPGEILAVPGVSVSVERINLQFADPWTEVDGQRAHKDTEHPFLTDPAVREAIATAIDRQRDAEPGKIVHEIRQCEMAATGVITPQQAEEDRRSPLVLAPPSGVERAPYVVEHLRRTLEDRFGELLYTGGLRIYTTIDSTLQAEAEVALDAVERAGFFKRLWHEFLMWWNSD